MGTSPPTLTMRSTHRLTYVPRIDIDVEGGGTTYYDSFIKRIRTLSSSSSKKYYVTGAPQCPYPDAYMST